MTTPRETSPISMLIKNFVLVFLLLTNVVGVALNTRDIKDNEKAIEFVAKDYLPAWALDAILKTDSYRDTEMIIRLTKVGDEKQKELNENSVKYLEFQNMIINSIAQIRGGYTNFVRSGPKNEKVKP